MTEQKFRELEEETEDKYVNPNTLTEEDIDKIWRDLLGYLGIEGNRTYWDLKGEHYKFLDKFFAVFTLAKDAITERERWKGAALRYLDHYDTKD